MVSHRPLEARFLVRIQVGQLEFHHRAMSAPPFFARGESASGGGGEVPGSNPGRAVLRRARPRLACSPLSEARGRRTIPSKATKWPRRGTVQELMSKWYLYLLECENGSFYTGVTQDLDRRFEEHRSGMGGHYTNYNRPKRIVYSESFANEILVKKREAQIKRWSNEKKRALIEGNLKKLRQLSISRD